MSSPNNFTKEFSKTVDAQSSINLLEADKITLQLKLDSVLDEMKVLGVDKGYGEDSLQQRQGLQSQSLELSKQLKTVENKISKLEGAKDDKTVSSALDTVLLAPINDFDSLYQPDKKGVDQQFYRIMLEETEKLQINSPIDPVRLNLIEEYLTKPEIKAIMSKATASGSTVGNHVDTFMALTKPLNELQQSKNVLKSAEKDKSTREANKLKKETQLAVIGNDLDAAGKLLANLDGDKKIETNITLDLDEKRNPHKLAKTQMKKGDDSSVEYAGVRFAGFEGVEIARVYQLALPVVGDSAKIIGNISKSIIANKEALLSYLSYRFEGAQNNQGGQTKAMLEKVKSINDSTVLNTSDTTDLKLMQIYLADFTGQVGILPFDVMKGTANTKINIQNSINNTEALPSSVMVDNAKAIDAASKLVDQYTKAKIDSLSPAQRRGLDFHLTGLYAYIRRNRMSMPDLRPTVPGDKGQPRPNGLSYFGDKVVSESNLGVISLGTAVTLLDRVLNDGKSEFHLDLNMIPSVAATTQGVQGYDLFVGPSGTYRFNAGKNTVLTTSVFAGTSMLRLQNATVGVALSAAQKIDNNKLGKSSKTLEATIGGGLSVIGGPYLTGYVGVSIDHIASINDNSEKLSTQFGPLLMLLEDKDLNDLNTFENFLKTNKKTLKDQGVEVSREFRDDLYGLVQVMINFAGGDLATLQKDNQQIFAQLVKDIYVHKEALDLKGARVGGGGIDLIRFISSAGLADKLTALFGIIKINNYRTLISQSGRYSLSASDYITNDPDLSTRATNIAQKFNQYFKGVIGLKEYKITSDDKGNITIPVSSSVYVNGAKVEKDITVSSQEDISMVVYIDHVDIITKKLEPKTEAPKVTSAVSPIPATSSINQIIKSHEIVVQENVESVACRKIENDFGGMKNLIIDKINKIDEKSTILSKGISHIKPYYNDLNINTSTTPLTQAQINEWLSDADSYRDNYDKNLGGLNAWMLAQWSTPNREAAYEVYTQLIRYETVLSGSFLERPKSNNNTLRVVQRDQKFATRLSQESAKEQLGTAKQKLKEAMQKVPYQGFATIGTPEAVGFTRGYDKNSYQSKVLTSNTFIAHPNSGKDGPKGFANIFVNTPLTDPAIIDYVNKGIGIGKIYAMRDNYTTAFKQTIDSTQLTINGESRSLSQLKELGYSYDLSSIDDSIINQKDAEITIFKDDASVGVISVKNTSGYYMVGNWQCAANETFVYVPELSGLVSINGITPVPVPAQPLIGSARVQVAQESMDIATTMRGGKLAGGFGLQENYYAPASEPSKPGEPYDTKSIPKLDANGKRIENQGSGSSSANTGFETNNPNVDAPKDQTGFVDQNPSRPNNSPYQTVVPIIAMQPEHPTGYHQYSSSDKRNPLEPQRPSAQSIAIIAPVKNDNNENNTGQQTLDSVLISKSPTRNFDNSTVIANEKLKTPQVRAKEIKIGAELSNTKDKSPANQVFNQVGSSVNNTQTKAADRDLENNRNTSSNTTSNVNENGKSDKSVDANNVGGEEIVIAPDTVKSSPKNTLSSPKSISYKLDGATKTLEYNSELHNNILNLTDLKDQSMIGKIFMMKDNVMYRITDASVYGLEYHLTLHDVEEYPEAPKAITISYNLVDQDEKSNKNKPQKITGPVFMQSNDFPKAKIL